MSTQPIEPTVSNGEHEPDSDAVEAFCRALESRVAAVIDDGAESLRAHLNRAAVAHEQAAEAAQVAVEESSAAALALDYLDSVLVGLVIPLRDALESENLIEPIVAACGSGSAEFESVLSALPHRALAELNPTRVVLASFAPIIAGLETALWNWTGAVLAAVISRDDSNHSAEQIEVSVDPGDGVQAVEPETRVPAFAPAAEVLREALIDICHRLSSLRENTIESFDNVAVSHRKSIARAVAERAPKRPREQSDPDDWASWYQSADHRLALCADRIALFLGTAAAQADLNSFIGNEITRPMAVAHASASAKLTTIGKKVDALFVQLTEQRDGRYAARGLFELLDEAMSTLERDLYLADGAARTIDALANARLAAEHSIHAEIGAIRQRYDLHALSVVGDQKAVKAAAASARFGLSETVNGAWTRWLEPGLSVLSRAVSDRLSVTEKEEQGLSAVLRFHFGAAIEELREVSWVSGTDAELADAQAAAHELARAGIERSLEALREVTTRFDEVVVREWAALTESRRRFHYSVESYVMAESGGSRLAHEAAKHGERLNAAARSMLAPVTRKVRRSATILIIRAVRSAKHLITYSRAVVGEVHPTDYQETISALSGSSQTRSQLPLVYRRLFSFHPLTDETLFAGRQSDIARLASRFKSWPQGRAGALVMTGAPGCGLTTLINVVRRTSMRGSRFHVLDLVGRVQNEAELVARLRETLRMEEAQSDEQVSLEGLASEILAQERADGLSVCVVEHLELLFIRAVDGAELLSRMLRFLSETDTRIFWITTTSDFAWQVIEKVAPSAWSLVTHYQVSEYNRPSLESIVMQRHNRSGLTIAFDPPERASTLLRRRLKQADSEKDTQAMLREAFFDDLFAACGQNIMLAIFYWLLAVRYEADPPLIRISALPVLNFDFLAKLGWPQLFALKALLEHGSLTAEEHSEIDNLDLDDSLEILEGLGNALTIERVGSDEVSHFVPNFERVERGTRYRIRPLMVQPIIGFLRGKNIVH